MYRLIWFQHIHKAAGTLIVNMAKANNEKMYIPNNNGNPTDDNGVVLPVWEYNNFELSKFIDNCEEMELHSLQLNRVLQISASLKWISGLH